MSLSRQEIFEFGPFRFFPAERRLYRGGECVPLSPKALDTLLVLVRNSGHLVTKSELLERVWPDSAVEENAINQKISELRKALENGGAMAFIETVPKAGYRFAAEVREPAAESVESRASAGDSRPESGLSSPLRFGVLAVLGVSLLAGAFFVGTRLRRPRTSPRDVHSMAVLPLRPLGSREEDKFLGLGIADSLITRLTYLREVAVRPTSAVRKYAAAAKDAAEAGRELGVDAVLDGTIQRAGDSMRVTIQFVSVRDGAPIWSAKLDEKASDLFTLEDRISEEVVHSLEVTVSRPERERIGRVPSKPDLQAYEDYLRGRYFWSQRTPASLRTAQEWFEKALGRDPSYALAYAGLADNTMLMGSFGVLSPKLAFPQAEAAAERAILLDSTLSQPHATLGYSKLFFDWDWDGAEREFRRAIELNPNYPIAHHWYSNFLMAMGHPDEAIAEMERARRLDPLSLPINAVLATHLWYAGRLDEAVAQVNHAMALDPNYAQAHEILGLIYESQGKYPEALVELEKNVALSGGGPHSIGSRGHLFAVLGDRKKAVEAIAQLEELSKGRQVLPFGIPRIYAALGDMDRAFAWLERSYADHAGDLVWLRTDPRSSAYRKDPRFEALLRRIGPNSAS